MSKSNSNIDMRTGPLFKQIILFALPVLLSGAIQNLFNIADMVVVGKFAGSNALAAVGATSSLCTMLVNFFIGFSMGSGVVASHFFGADDNKRLSRVVNTAFVSSFIIGVFLVFVAYAFAEPILRIMNTPEEIISDSSLYIKIFFLGMPANMVFNFMNSISRSVGDTKTPMIYLSISGVVNILLNLLFVIVFDMSVAGVATATIISQYIAAALITLKFIKAPYPLRLNIRAFKLDFNILKSIFVVGLPAGIQSVTVSLSNVIIQSAVNFFGASVVAGYTAGSNIGGFVYVALNSIYQTAMTMTAQNYGCNNFKRIKKGFFISEATVTVLGIIVCSAAVIFKDPLLRIFTDDPVAISAGYKFFNICVTTYLLCGVMEVLTGCLRGLGKSLEAMIVTICTMAVFRIVWNYTVFVWARTLEVVFISYPISWTLSIVILAFMLKRCLKKAEQQSFLPE